MSESKTDQDALTEHLFFQDVGPDGVRYFSSLVAAIRDGRWASNRDLKTGALLNNGKGHGSWLGTLAYFTALDQIGTCFSIKGKKADGLTGIKAALLRFTDLDQLTRDALYALRCSFAHDYSLFNISRNSKKPELTHRFTVLADPEYPLVKLAPKQWNGDLYDHAAEVFTLVNLLKLCDLVEQIYANLIELSTKNELRIILSDGSKELLEKYGHAIVKIPR